MNHGKQPWVIYMIETKGGRLYTGITNDLDRRFEEHSRTDRGAKFFRLDRPKKIVFQKEVATRSEALKEERRIKQLSRPQKWKLIEC